MANKEERILIDIIEPGLNCVYRMDNNPKGLSLCKHNGEEEPVSEKDCKSCLEGMTRQEAISKIEIRLKVFLDNLQKNKDKVMPWYTTRDIAEEALTALLESK